MKIWYGSDMYRRSFVTRFFPLNKQTFEWTAGFDGFKRDSPLVGAEDPWSEGGHQVVGQAE